MIFETAPAKVNLFLHVGERHDDGYHPLQSLAVFTDVADRLAIDVCDDLRLNIDGPFAQGLSAQADNLVLKAARALSDKGAQLTLTKNLPVASGIGGGSADAAAALRGLCRFWNLSMADCQLHEIALALGSDIPVCLNSVASFMQGRGELLSPLQTLPRVSMLLVNPGVAVGTKEVFGALKQRRGIEMSLPSGGFHDTADLLRFLEIARNDLETPACEIQPVICDVLTVLSSLPGALFSRMSGSGATCFAIFPDDDCCNRAAKMLKSMRPSWWIAPTYVPEIGIVREQAGRDFAPSHNGL